MKIRGDFFTSIDQSKHLFDLGLDPETADMCWGIDDDTMKYNNNPYPLPWKDYTAKEFYLPCWSLGALMDVMPSGCNLSTPKPMNALPYCCWNQDTEFYGRTSISAAIAMINWLIENNKMCEEAVETEDEKLREQVVYAINQLHVCECTKNKLIAWVKKQHEEKLLNNDKYQTVSVEILDRLYESEKELERLKQGEQKPETIFLKFRIDDKVTNGEDTYTIDFIGKDRYWVKEHDCATIPFEHQHHWELVGQKPTDKVEPKFKVGDKIKLAKEPKYPAREIIAIKNDAYYFDMLVHLPFSHQDEWELVEKKSANKVEPKFKVGDWIANGKFTWYVKEFKNNLYRLISSDGTEVCDTISFVKRNFHLWTIKDAKDGDVLSYNDGHGNDCIELIKSITDWNKDKKIEFWFCLTNNEIYEVFDGICPYTNMTSRQNAAPATKEQCNLLFQKMKEAGYEWDADKKELKKIEQNPLWSEEDENYKNALISLINEIKNQPLKRLEDWDGYIDWLKSLKERVGNFDDGYKVGFSAAKYNQWKPWDEQMEVLYKYAEQNNYDGSVLTSLYRDLKKLKGE